MSRVLMPDGPTWYEQLKAVSYYNEGELERFIREHVAALFPSFWVFPFKKDVEHKATGDVRKPDLAMVRRDYQAWGVIEVELSEHNLKHILKQTECFAEGNYNAPEVAKYMRKQIDEHCGRTVVLKKLEELVSSELPMVLVIADAHVEEWLKPLQDVKAALCVFEVFKNANGSFVYRIFGAYPIVQTKELQCRRHASFVNVLEIVGDFAFKRKKGEVEISFNGVMTR
jgi:hypothetical protein